MVRYKDWAENVKKQPMHKIFKITSESLKNYYSRPLHPQQLQESLAPLEENCREISGSPKSGFCLSGHSVFRGRNISSLIKSRRREY